MLYYCKTPNGNFGDDLNPWLWPRLAPEVCMSQHEQMFVGIGTILTRKIPSVPLKFVFGSGCWASGPLLQMDDRWNLYCVRGPMTAARLNLNPKLALADPAILVRRFAGEFAGAKPYRVSFMPHLQSMPHADWPALCAQIGFHCIDPRAGVERVLRELQATELLLSEAMHGAIVADAVRVPWIPVRMYGKFAEFKWQDWAQSIRVPLMLSDVPPVYARPPRAWKRVDYTVKKNLARAGMGPANWKRLGTRRSTEAEIHESLAELKRVTETRAPCLSEAHRLLQLESRPMETLSTLRADWTRSVAPA